MARITIGADPEFAFLDSNGRLKRPESVIRGANGDDGFGIDGSGRVAELRPAYANSPKELVAHIKAVMQDGINAFPSAGKLKWKAGGVAQEEPMGGHVHLGHDRLRIREVATKVGDALNRIVAPIVLMAEDREEAVLRRIGSNYGQLVGENCWREQPWGMEYRVLSSWLTSPEDALSVLSLTYLVGKNFDNSEFLDAALELPEVDNDFFVDCNKRVIAFYLQQIAVVLKKATGFRDSFNEFRPLVQMIVEGKTFNVDRDMKEAWGLVIPPVPVGVE